MAKTCVARIEAADVKPLSGRAVPSRFGIDPRSGEAFVFASQETVVEAIVPPDWSPEERVVAEETRLPETRLPETKLPEAEIVQEKERGECSFWFVDADFLRASKDRKFPVFQDLQRKPGVLHSKMISFDLALGQKLSRGEFCIVSHRWFDKTEPDYDGQQLKRVQEYLRRHPDVKYVWFDYWCMPQGEKTASEKQYFNWMLANINILYCTSVSPSSFCLISLTYPGFGRSMKHGSLSRLPLRTASGQQARLSCVAR